MPQIEYPPGMPCPRTSTVTPAERRLISEGYPRQLRTIEHDERQQQTLTWTLTADQSRRFKAWWISTLVYGGAWFSAPAHWPTPQGLVVKVRRFIGAPSWQYIGKGLWNVSAECEVRGESLLPMAGSTFYTSAIYPYEMEHEAASVEAALVDGDLEEILIHYENWRDVAPDAIDVLAAALLNGTLTLPIVPYTNWRTVAPDEIDVLAPSLITGTLTVVLVYYSNWRDVAPDAIDLLAPGLVTGTLIVVIVPYSNWRNVAPEAIDVLEPSLLTGTLA